MGYFDGLTEASFKKNSDQQTLFYPWGALGKGYLVVDAQKEQELRRFTKLNYLIVVPLVVLNQIFFGVVPNLVLLPVYIVVFIYLLKKQTAGLPVVTEKLKVSEAYQNSARRHSLFTLIVLALASALFSIAGILFIVEGRNVLLGIFALGLFGTSSVVISYMAWSKIKNK